MDEKRIAAIFKAFCDENRIRIIKLLRSGEKCARRNQCHAAYAFPPYENSL